MWLNPITLFLLFMCVLIVGNAIYTFTQTVAFPSKNVLMTQTGILCCCLCVVSIVKMKFGALAWIADILIMISFIVAILNKTQVLSYIPDSMIPT